MISKIGIDGENDMWCVYEEYVNTSDECIEKCNKCINKDINLAMFYNNASIGFKEKALKLSLEDASLENAI